eukprot:scaffold13199_cov62-Attheya_sp.AAC.8
MERGWVMGMEELDLQMCFDLDVQLAEGGGLGNGGRPGVVGNVGTMAGFAVLGWWFHHRKQYCISSNIVLYPTLRLAMIPISAGVIQHQQGIYITMLAEMMRPKYICGDPPRSNFMIKPSIALIVIHECDGLQFFAGKKQVGFAGCQSRSLLVVGPWTHHTQCTSRV